MQNIILSGKIVNSIKKHIFFILFHPLLSTPPSCYYFSLTQTFVLLFIHFHYFSGAHISCNSHFSHCSFFFFFLNLHSFLSFLRILLITTYRSLAASSHFQHTCQHQFINTDDLKLLPHFIFGRGWAEYAEYTNIFGVYRRTRTRTYTHAVSA